MVSARRNHSGNVERFFARAVSCRLVWSFSCDRFALSDHSKHAGFRQTPVSNQQVSMTKKKKKKGFSFLSHFEDTVIS
ncbi:hypothetical protein MUK42_23316 [Musa troglodytarum]|uniref:Uncharacterized protein n=1 Tax=Musa troglodytarum TaxID=320322 RepID=A0A9E7JKN1_9LILI|nr:hypothetical protein MUK42_23316 [Musa troglodytarum]